MSKPREFWIRRNTVGTYSCITKPDYVRETDTKVIEKAAYDELVRRYNAMVTISKSLQDVCKKVEPEMSYLKAKADKLAKVLDFYARHHHRLNTTARNIADEALKEYRGELDNLK